MKLGTLRNGTRDGRLVVVSTDVTLCSDAHHIAPTLRDALDNWDRVAPHLDLIARGIESGGQPTERFHEREAHAPLPRAFRWVEPAGADLTLRASDGFLDPRAAIRGTTGARIGLVAITGDVPQGADRATARDAIRLLMLVNLFDGTADTGSGPVSFSPVAVTPDSLPGGWEGHLSGTLTLEVNGKPLRRLTGADLECDLAALVVAAARTRALSAGSLVGSGPIAHGDVTLAPGDRLRIEMRDPSGHSLFGAIEQGILAVEAAA